MKSFNLLFLRFAKAIVIFSFCINLSGCNRNSQKVELVGIAIDSSQILMPADKIITAKNRGGDEYMIKWPIDDFYKLTGGEAFVGMKLAIHKTGQNDWKVTKVISSKKEHNNLEIVQKVKVFGADVKILADNTLMGKLQAPLYTGILNVESTGGNKIKAYWPDSSFFSITNGIIEKGLSVEITRNIKDNSWIVTNVFSKPFNKIEQIKQDSQYVNPKRRLDIGNGYVMVDLKTGEIKYTLNQCPISGFLGETEFDGLMKYRSGMDSSINANCIYIDGKTQKAKDIYFTGYFEYSNRYFNNRFMINNAEFGRLFKQSFANNPLVIQFNVTAELLENQTIQLFRIK